MLRTVWTTRRWQALYLAGMLAGISAAVPAAAMEDVPVPGGIRALAGVMQIDPAPEPARALAEFARIVHELPEGSNKEIDAGLERLAAHVRAVSDFEEALAHVQTDAAGISLALASNKNTRNRLKAFLDLLGLALIEKKQAFSVQPRKDKEAAERVRLLDNIGIDLDGLATRLNAGESVRLTIPTERVPVPLSTDFWARTIFKRPVAPVDLISAILSDRRASLLARGFMALDDDTLTFMEQHPALVVELYEGRASAFGAFGASLRVRGDRVTTPGGPEAVALWEKAAGRKVTQGDEFVKELFGAHGGKLAYLYSAIADLDEPRRRFALGLWIKDETVRADRFQALVDATLASVGEWDLEKRPFFRPAYDAAYLLASVRVDRTGGPVAPNARRFWARAFDTSDLPDDPARELRNVDEDGVIDAAWVVDQVATGDLLRRTSRFAQFRFGQRAFAGADVAQQPDTLVAVRAAVKFAALVSTLDRINVSSASTYAALARQGEVLNGLDPSRAHTALRQFQSSVSLAARAAQAGTLTAPQSEAVLLSLARVRLNGEGWYAGAVAQWLEGPFATAIGAAGPLTESALIDAAAGIKPTAESPRVITWEDRSYRVDLPASEARRARRIRDKQKTAALDTALLLQRQLANLSAPEITLAAIQSGSAELKRLAAALPQKKLAPGEWPTGVDVPPDPQQLLLHASQELAKITREKDVRKAARVAADLSDVADRLLADGLTALTYAFALGDADGTALLGGDASTRHDFGFADVSKFKRGAWDEPRQELAAGRPWRVQGSLFGLDIALGRLAMRRLTTDKIAVPKIAGNDAAGFVRGFALLDPYAMADADQAAIAQAIARGRQRVSALQKRPDDLAAVADAAGLDGWRRRAVQWSLTSAPDRVESYFSMSELLTLGQVESRPSLDSWGTSVNAGSGCFCTELEPRSPWWAATGRNQLGILPAAVPDVHLRVAVALQSLGLPAVLAKGVLSAVVRRFLDDARPMDADDWLGLVRFAQATSDELIEDAVAALTASGPLLPANTRTAATSQQP
jgi:hypothetical protein